MYRYFTYEKWTKVSIQSHEHATVRMGVNTLDILSREKVRSVGRRWERIATISANGSSILFETDDTAVRMIATQMQRDGWRLLGGIKLDPNEFGVINVQKSNGNITNPESIRGRIRNRNPGSPTDKRRKVQAAFGGIGECNLFAMRKAILARRAISETQTVEDMRRR